MADPYRIVLADDHVLFRRELKKIIQKAAGLEVVGEVGDGAALLQVLEQARPDLVIIDLSLPQLRAMEATRLIKRIYPQVKVLVMSLDHEEEYLTYTTRAGADGVLLKQYSAVELLEAITTIRAGKFYLAPQFGREKSCIATATRSWSVGQLGGATSR